MESNQSLKEKRKIANKNYYQKKKEILKSTGIEFKVGRPRTRPIIVDPDDTVTWKDVVGFDNYQVSDCGHVRNKKTKKLLRPDLTTHPITGRQTYRVTFYKNGDRTRKLVHTVMADAFALPKREDQTQLDHIDQNSLNNILSNLRWATPKENMHNRKLTKSNISGFRGVSWNKQKKKWVAQFNDKNSKQKHISYFHCKLDAYCAYLNAMVNEYGFDNVIPELQADYNKYCVEPLDLNDGDLVVSDDESDNPIRYCEYKCRYCDDKIETIYSRLELIEHYVNDHDLVDDHLLDQIVDEDQIVLD